MSRYRQAVDAAMPELSPARGRGRSVRNQVEDQPTTAIYEAGARARRTLSWNPPTVSPNALLGTLSTLRDRSRDATRNNGYAKGVIDKLVTNLIGTGIKPLSQADDHELRGVIQELFLEWTDECDADGQLDFYGLQALATRVWLEGGDSYARLRFRLPSDGLTVPLQIQVLEPELCPHTYTGFAKNGNKIRGGIEFNAIGQRVAYYFHPTRPELDDFDASELKRIPAEQVVHLYDPMRAGQLRGIPHLTQALVRLHELDKFDDATLRRQQISNLFAAFVKKGSTLSDTAGLDPLTGEEVNSDEPPTLQFEPGLIQELMPDEDVTFSTPPGTSDGYADFMRQQLRAIATSTGVPYEVLTGDMTGMNDRTVRVVLNEFKRRMQMVQHSIIAFKFCRPIWSAWLYRAFLSGALPIPESYLDDPVPFAAVKWMPSRWPYLHPVQDVEADREAIRAGFTTRSAVVSEYGEDAAAIDEEQAEDNERADGLGLKYSSDSRVPSAPSQRAREAEPAEAAAGATS